MIHTLDGIERVVETEGSRSGAVRIGSRTVGAGQPTYVIAEVGINHNGDLETAKALIDAAGAAGCDAVKFQKRTPHVCVPTEQKTVIRNTPWGALSYLDYRQRMEFSESQYREIDNHCRGVGIPWFASAWDEESVIFLERFSPPCHKICSAALTDDYLVRYINETGRPVILSTGMSTMSEIQHAVSLLNRKRLLIAHCTSAYAGKSEELNLRVIQTLGREFGCPIGYSGHERGIATSVAAVALGATFVERHITLDRRMWGSDQACSLEPSDFRRLVSEIRDVERALGDGFKRVYDSEKAAMQRLRQVS